MAKIEGQSERSQEDELDIHGRMKHELKIPENALEAQTVLPEKVHLESEFGNLEITIWEFNKKNYEGLIGEKELDEYLKVLEDSKDLFGKMILDEEYRKKALECLSNFFIMYAAENFPEDSPEEAGAHKNMAEFGDRIYENQIKIKRFACLLIERLQPAIEKSKKEIPDNFDNKLVMELYQELVYNLEYGEEGRRLRAKGAEFLVDYMPEIERGLDEQDWETYLQYVSNILFHGSGKSIKEASEMVARTLLTCDDDLKFWKLLRFMLESPYTLPEAQEVIEAELIKVGLPPFEVHDAWRLSANSENRIEAIIANVDKIRELEKVRPGCVRFLYNKFGICDFERYPNAILLDMVENYSNKEKPYGMIIYPRNDWNGAFRHNDEVFRKLHEQLGGEFLLRVAECENKTDIAKMLVKLDKLYNSADGSGNKISLLILGGHGERNSIKFGGQDAKHSLYTEDLAGKGVQKTGKFFAENPTIILNSCSTGAEKGIGQELSQRFGAKVIAPKVPTNLSAIHAIKNNEGKFEFDAEYHQADSKNSYAEGNLANKE